MSFLNIIIFINYFAMAFLLALESLTASSAVVDGQSLEAGRAGWDDWGNWEGGSRGRRAGIMLRRRIHTTHTLQLSMSINRS